MCGIAGILQFDGQVNEEDLKCMRDRLQHRGPDDRGIYMDGSIGLVHTHLKITSKDESSHQPMKNEDGRLWITYNGEIYNHHELKNELSRILPSCLFVSIPR